jgi:hypothetical protein
VLRIFRSCSFVCLREGPSDLILGRESETKGLVVAFLRALVSAEEKVASSCTYEERLLSSRLKMQKYYREQMMGAEFSLPES